MKRLFILIIIGIVVGKAFVSAVVSLSKSTSSHTSHYNIDKTLDSNMRLAPIPDSESPTDSVVFPHMVFHGDGALVKDASGHPVTVAPKTKVVAAAKNDKDKKDKDKEKEDDEKRKKKLEEENAKKNISPITVQGAQVTQNPLAPTDYNNFQGPLVPNPPVAPTSPVPLTNTAGNNAPASSIASWLDALTHRPTPALMTSFIGLYQKKQITTAQFYQVLSAMQKSPVLLARQDAISAAAMEQTSQSFQILADESQTEIDGTTKNAALQAVSAFGNVNDLPVLSQALAGGDLNAKLEASAQLTTVVQSFGVNKNSALAQSLFMPFVSILRAITISQVPTLLQTNAQTVLNEITSLLGIAAV